MLADDVKLFTPVRVEVLVGLVILAVASVVLIGRGSQHPKSYADAKALMDKIAFTHYDGSAKPVAQTHLDGYPIVIQEHCKVMFNGFGGHGTGQVFGLVCDSRSTALAADAWMVKAQQAHARNHPAGDRVDDGSPCGAPVAVTPCQYRQSPGRLAG